MAKAATVEDVARRAGVSRQTVSNVINSPAVVREETRVRVQRAIDELAYRPHVAARSLRTRRSSTIGVHIDPFTGGISGVILDRFIHALTENANERALRVLIYSARSKDEEIARLSDLIDGGEIDAAVITGTAFGDPRTGWLDGRRLPYAAFGRPWGGGDVWESGHSWVDVDGAAGTRAATRHALESWGARVAWLGWPPDAGTGDDRERGWREAMGASGLTGRVFRVPDSVAEARSVMAEAFADPVVRDGIDAVVCVSDALAVGAHLAAVDTGATGIGLIGFDNTPVAEALGLSSVEQAPELVAGAVLDLLTDDTGRRIAGGEGPPERMLVEPRLVVR
ncbi:LacI family DNA-binding transcriptional regulator [Microbacterium sp. ET2]|uniref:LacI family DNA-binding transcriptional regulator n=1 Tax=Microbacterium albipurpureum TaxID=3050384 RepID=UPI00259D2731|nr:LacI family DNA-binding transcriptional regulator [Microbacterium sp. ET2 (Ac-2212)]WJL96104.1 LacI family DNA-binding transcriptional regulator [Microbacterium sp. ET2 (Ac-2212)]